MSLRETYFRVGLAMAGVPDDEADELWEKYQRENSYLDDVVKPEAVKVYRLRCEQCGEEFEAKAPDVDVCGVCLQWKF